MNNKKYQCTVKNYRHLTILKGQDAALLKNSRKKSRVRTDFPRKKNPMSLEEF